MHNTVISNIDKLTGKMKGTDREKKTADADQGRLASEESTKENGGTPRGAGSRLSRPVGVPS